MKQLIHLVGIALLLSTSSLLASGAITGVAAKRVWDSLPGPEAGPFCTGVCLPGRPCDPACFYTKMGQGWQCSRIEYRKSHRIEYECSRSR